MAHPSLKGTELMRTHPLTPEQRECVSYAGDTLLIRGAPGSGKTTTLLYRALALAERRQSPDETVVIFTYNKTLAAYARQLVEEVNNSTIHVTTFHSWAWRELKRCGLAPARHGAVVHGHERAEIIKSAVDTVRATLAPERRHKVLASGIEFWVDEIEWIKGRMIEDLATYERVMRTGRVDPLRIPARRVVWQVYETYQSTLQRLDRLDYDDFALLLLHQWEIAPDELLIDHVLIDESQDFQAAQLELLARFVRQTITIIADEGQRIYKRSFSWADLGVEVVGGGRSRVLRQTFRPTRQILACAQGLRLEESLGPYADLPAVEVGVPVRDGPVPVVYVVRDGGANALQAQCALAAEIFSLLMAQADGQTIGVLARHWSLVDGIADYLDQTSDLDYEHFKERGGNVMYPGVKLMTFHSAKGLEFDQVILLGVDEGVVPLPPGADMTPEESEDHLRYERRLLYVAMTRARDALYILHGTAPSPFLAELDPATYERQVRTIQSVAPRRTDAFSAADDIPF